MRLIARHADGSNDAACAEHLGKQLGRRTHWKRDSHFHSSIGLEQVRGAKEHAGTADILGCPLAPACVSDGPVFHRHLKTETLSASRFNHAMPSFY